MGHVAERGPDRGRQIGRRGVGCTALAVALSLALLAWMCSGQALGATVHPFITQFGAFTNPQAVAVDQATGDIYVIDVGTETVSRFGSDLLPKDFSALGTNVLDGAGAGDCAITPASCDQTPENGFLFDQPDAAQVAIDSSGGPADGDIYVTDSLHDKVDVFAPSGAYLGQLTGTSSGPFGESCGVAVDSGGSVYVGDFFSGVHKFVPSANPVTDADFSADIATANPCDVATGSAGSVFANHYHGAVTKFDALGQALYVVTDGPVSNLAVDPATDHMYGITAGAVAEYDASGPLSASLVTTFGSPQVGNPSGIAVASSSGRIYVADNARGVVAVFGTATLDVRTGDASDVGSTSATVSGVVNPLGVPTSWQFEYGTDTSYGSSAPASPGDAGSGSDDVPVGAQLAGLTPNTTYHYRLDATNGNGTAHGEDRTFTTVGPPLLQADRLFNVSSTGAIVSGQLSSRASPISYRVEYGTSTSYGASAPVPDGSLPARPDFQLVKVALQGLEPSTTYHWRFVATNEFGTTAGPDHVFQTDATAQADTIPRPPGGVDGRAYELVSQAHKNGDKVNVAVASAGGNRAIYHMLSGGTPGSTSGVATLAADRTPTGWVSHNALPPRLDMLRSNYFLEATTPDVGLWIAAAKDGLGGTTGSPGVGLALLTDTGSQTTLHVFPTDFGVSGVSVVASDDLRHVFVASPEPIDPSHVPGTVDVYDFGGAAPVLVSAMPGTNLAPACGIQGLGSTTMDFPDSGFNAASEHWSSTDGSRVFFSTPGDDCSSPHQLYMRDLPTATTTLVSGPPIAGAPDNGVDRFLQATPDGSQAFFRTATSYTAADHADGDDADMDIYRWLAADHELTCVTCAVPEANVPQATGAFANAAIPEDGSHVYFPSAAQGAGAPAPGDAANPNLYVWRASDASVHFIAQVGLSNIGLANVAANGGETTPDGNVLLFQGTGPGLDEAAGTPNGGFMQYYRYDDRDGSVTCVSCLPGTAPTSDVPVFLAQPFPAVLARARVMTDDGRMVFFVTSDALVPHDVNGGPDIYEWHDGAVKLITNGRTDYPAGLAPVPIAVAAGGRDFFFLDPANLTPQAEDGTNKLYDARIGGGFAATTPAAACVGEQCQAPPHAPPALPELGARGSGAATSRPFTVARISHAQLLRFARTGRLTLLVRVRTAARLSARVTARLRGHTVVVARASRRAQPGIVRLTLRLSRRARHALATRGRLRLTVRIVQSSRPIRVKRLVIVLTAPSGGGRA